MKQCERQLKQSPDGRMLPVVAHYNPLSTKQQQEELWISS
jgi:ribosomal protein S16